MTLYTCPWDWTEALPSSKTLLRACRRRKCNERSRVPSAAPTVYAHALLPLKGDLRRAHCTRDASCVSREHTTVKPTHRAVRAAVAPLTQQIIVHRSQSGAAACAAARRHLLRCAVIVVRRRERGLQCARAVHQLVALAAARSHRERPSRLRPRRRPLHLYAPPRSVVEVSRRAHEEEGAAGPLEQALSLARSLAVCVCVCVYVS